MSLFAWKTGRIVNFTRIILSDRYRHGPIAEKVYAVLTCHYHGVMSRQKTRAKNLRLLWDEFGTLRELARRGDTSEKYLSLVANEKLQGGKPRMLGNDVADRLEAACDKYPGWLDIDHDNPPRDIGDLPPSANKLVELWLRSDDRLRESIMALARLAE